MENNMAKSFFGVGGGSGITESQAQNLISNYGAWTIEDNFTSFETQAALLDVPSPMSFGASKVSQNGLISYDDTNKRFTALKSGAYLIKTRGRAARVGGNQGTSELFVQAQDSIDGGASWIPRGNSVDLTLQNNSEVEMIFDFAAIYVPAPGVMFRQVFARSSTGSDFGSLISGVPSAALVAAGMATSPAAQVSVYRLIDYDYE